MIIMASALTAVAGVAQEKPAAPAAPQAAQSAKPADADPNPVIITAGTIQVRKSEFETAVKTLPEQYQGYAMGPGKRQFADDYLRMKMLAAEGMSAGLQNEPEVVEQLSLMRENLVANAELQKIEKGVTISDADVQKYYDDHKSEYETVKARHILIAFKGSPAAQKGKKELTEEEAKAKADALRTKLAAGGDFAAAAKAESDDSGSGANGGDLGTFSRGQMVPEFEKACFELKPTEVSGIVTTTYGYHIVQVLERESARVKPFEEVKTQLADELKKEGLSDKVQALGDQVRAALAKNPAGAADVAKQYGVDVVTESNVTPGTAIPSLGVSPEIDNALNTLKKNEVSQLLVLPANRLAVVVLTDKVPARQSEFSEAEAKVRDRVASDEAGVVATAKAKEAAQKIQAGADMAQVAKSMKLDVVESIDFTHTDSVEGLGQAAFVGDAFTKPIGSVVGPVLVQGRNIVYKILDQQHPDLTKLVQERAAVLDQVKKRKAISQNSLFLDSVYSKLVTDGKVKKYPDAIKRLIASFRS